MMHSSFLAVGLLAVGIKSSVPKRPPRVSTKHLRSCPQWGLRLTSGWCLPSWHVRPCVHHAIQCGTYILCCGQMSSSCLEVRNGTGFRTNQTEPKKVPVQMDEGAWNMWVDPVSPPTGPLETLMDLASLGLDNKLSQPEKGKTVSRYIPLPRRNTQRLRCLKLSIPSLGGSMLFLEVQTLQ